MFSNYLQSFCVFKVEHNWFGGPGHVHQVRKKHEHEEFSGSPKSKSYSSRTKQNNCTEFSGHSFHKTCNENGPRNPHRPLNGIFRQVSLFSTRVLKHKCLVVDFHTGRPPRRRRSSHPSKILPFGLPLDKGRKRNDFL